MTDQPQFLIATPTYGGSIKTDCHLSLMKLVTWLHAQRINYVPICMDVNGISTVRNFYGSLIYQEKQFTHLLFIDNDMVFQPELVGRLFKADKPMIGCICPKRSIALDQFYAAAKTEPYDVALARATSFTIPDDTEPTALHFEKGIGRIKNIGMAATLIKRSVFARMVSTGKLRSEIEPEAARFGLTGPLYGFFDEMLVDGKLNNEDWSFCERWQLLCGGETWAIYDAEIGHIGSFTYRANFAALKKNRAV